LFQVRPNHSDAIVVQTIDALCAEWLFDDQAGVLE
jgi:hypothetical protein